MTSPQGSALGGRGRALLAALAFALLVLGVFATLWLRRGDVGRASAPEAGAPAAGASAHAEGDAHAFGVTDLQEPTNPAPAPGRAAVASPAPKPSSFRAGPFLIGRLLDEGGRPLAHESARVDVVGSAGQRLQAPVDAAGGFGPLRLVPGTWVVTARARGRRSAQRTLALVEGAQGEALELVLPRVVDLDVHLVASGPGRDGDAERDLGELAGLLSLRLVVAGEEDAQTRRVPPPEIRALERRERSVRFEPLAGRASTLELRLGSQTVLRRDLAADTATFTLAIDPLDLLAQMVELVLVLNDGTGRPLAGAVQALLAWDDDVNLVSEQLGIDPSRARFELCPPGPARLRVVDVEGRRATAELLVPHVGPAVIEVALELRELPFR